MKNNAGRGGKLSSPKTPKNPNISPDGQVLAMGAGSDLLGNRQPIGKPESANQPQWAPPTLVAIITANEPFVDMESYAVDKGSMRDLTADELDRIADGCRATAELKRSRAVRS